MITSGICLGVETFITGPQKGDLPSCAFVSLDIKNMFNIILCQKLQLREVTEKEFSELSTSADLLYESEGRIGVKMADDTWSYISVHEAFSQDCPMLFVFIAIILKEIS